MRHAGRKASSSGERMARSGRRLVAVALLLAALAAADECDDSTATNYDPTSSNDTECFGPPHSLHLVSMPRNGTVAGQQAQPSPVVEVRDALGRRVRRHAPFLVVRAEYPVVVWQQALTGGAESSADSSSSGDSSVGISQVRSVVADLVNGTANFTGELAITYANATMQLTFRLASLSAGVLSPPAPLVSPPFSVLPAAPTALIVLHEPHGGMRCEPFFQQPRVALKDAWNNTVGGSDGPIVAELVGTAGPLTGGTVANLSDGVAGFASLGVGTNALGFQLRFSQLAAGDDERLAPTYSSYTDCHAHPSALRLLPGAPLGLEVVDAEGLRVTAAEGAPLLAFLQYPDGSQYATSSATLSARGVWQFDHASDPLNAAREAGVASIIFSSNMSDYLPHLSNASCCSLLIPRADVPGESLETLFTPPISIARLIARNTGRQGGFGVGDTIELTTNIRTDRAGFGVGELLDRRAVDALLIFSHELGSSEKAYAGAWRDDCTFLLVAGNVTDAPAPETGVFSVRLRDDVHELRDAAHQLKVGSVAASPKLEGHFGAQGGEEGRTDPLRMAFAELAIKRYNPNDEAHYFAHHRTGPMPWHPPVKWDPDRDRSSECDVDRRVSSPLNRLEPESIPLQSYPPEGEAAIIRAVLLDMAGLTGLPPAQTVLGY